MFGFGKRKPPPQKQKRKKLSDVKAGDVITVENIYWIPQVVNVLVLNNDPDDKKMVIEIIMNGLKTRIVYEYTNSIFKSFHLLNSVLIPATNPLKGENVNSVSEIEKQIKEAVEKEDFETVLKLQKQLKQLTDKK